MNRYHNVPDYRRLLNCLGGQILRSGGTDRLLVHPAVCKGLPEYYCFGIFFNIYIESYYTTSLAQGISNHVGDACFD